MVEQKTTLELKLEKLRDICEKAPDHHIGLLALAETAFRRGLRLEALEAYQKVLREESVAEAHLCMAQMYRHHGLVQETIAELRVLFELEPGYPEAVAFASELAEETELPEDIQAIVVAGCGSDELALAKVRLSIARSLVLREGQELMAIQEANAGDPTFGYYIGETRKRLIYCEQVLSQLGQLEETRRIYQQEQARKEANAKHTAPVAEDSGPEIAGAELVQAQETQEELSGSDPSFEQGEEVYPATESEETYGEEVQEEVVDTDDVPGAPSEDETEVSAWTQEEQSLDSHSSGQDLGSEVEPTVSPGLWEDTPPLVLNPVESERTPEESHPLVSWGGSVEIEPELPNELPGTGELWDDPRPLPLETNRLSSEENSLGLGLDLAIPPVEPDFPEHLVEIEPSTTEVGELEDTAYIEESLDSISTVSVEAPQVELEVVEETISVIQDVVPETSSPASAETEAVAAIDFASHYSPLLGALDTLMQTLAKTRSVSSIYLVNREGYCILEIAKDNLSQDRLHEFVCETVSFLETFAESPQYWVLECSGGIVVIQSVDGYHYLVTIGQSGANFGALRFTMDRIRPSFAEALLNALPST